MKYFLHLSYDGTHYSGWQRQENTPKTVQETIEYAFSKILGEKISIYGCGRTDAGVHADDFYAHFDYEGSIPKKLISILTFQLPTDIAIKACIPVDNHRHTRYDATSRTYHYQIHFHSDPFINRYSTIIQDKTIDVALLEKCVHMLHNYTDYQMLCKQPDKHKSTICHIHEARVESIENHHIKIIISANRFLRGMVRIIVQQCLDVASGEIDIAHFQKLLEGTEARKYQNTAPPQGLHLMKVEYPYAIQ